MEGIGDEVVGVMVSFLAMTIVALLWKTTHVRETPPIHSVVITATPIRHAHSHGHTHTVAGGRVATATLGNATEAAADRSSNDSSPRTAPEATETRTAEGTRSGGQNEREAAEEEEAVVSDESEPEIRIKLRFLDETTMDVVTRLSERLSRFRRRHLDAHLNLGPADKVKLIFNGKIIHRDAQQLSEAGIYDNCVVHCLVQREQAATAAAAGTAATAGAGGVPPAGGGGDDIFQSELDLQAFCFPLLGTILFGCWWFLLFYSQHFTMLGAMSLVSLTVLYLASLANLMLY